MKLRNRPPRPEPGDTQGTWTLGPDTELYEPYGEIDPYPVREVHPALRTMARVGLWTAVVIGCLGGLIGLASPGAGTRTAPPVARSDQATGVPGPVAGVAERAVATWLTATDSDGLSDLFVDVPPTVDGEPVAVTRADVVAGEATGDDDWAVTVAVDVVVTPTDDDAEPVRATWYAELTVVGDQGGGLRALTTPALVPAPADVGEWRTEGRDAQRLDPEDPLAAMVTGFLEALVVGQGDPAPYLARGVDVAPVRPSPFSALEVGAIRAARTDEDEARVWAEASGTAGRASYAVGYQIDVVRRDGRWEVAAVTGAAAGSRGDGDEADAGRDRDDEVDRPIQVNDPFADDGDATDVNGDASDVGGDTTEVDDDAMQGEGQLPDDSGGALSDPGT